MEQITMFEQPERQHAKQYGTVCRFIGAHNMSKQDRQEHDFYATEPIAAEWLLKLERLRSDIWEPACGAGHLSKIFEQHGYKVRSTDLIDRGYGEGGVDFLQQQEKWAGDIVTNPPYKLAQNFIEHALEITEDGALICMFLKVQFLEGKTRASLFDNTPPPHSLGFTEPHPVRTERQLRGLFFHDSSSVVRLGEGLQGQHNNKVV